MDIDGVYDRLLPCGHFALSRFLLRTSLVYIFTFLERAFKYPCLTCPSLADQFCSFFDEKDVDVMNYINDLSAYWKKGYGFRINYEIACVLMQNIMVSLHAGLQSFFRCFLIHTHFQDAITQVISSPVDQHSLRASLRFAHAETIMPLVRHRPLLLFKPLYLLLMIVMQLVGTLQ